MTLQFPSRPSEVSVKFIIGPSGATEPDNLIEFFIGLQRTEDLSIMTAVATKHSDLVSHLLSRNPHLVDVVEPIWGLTPLIIAAGLGCNYVLQSLIDSGAKVDQMDKSGWTPLTMALAHKCEPETILPTSHGYIKYLFSRIEIVRLLLSFNPAVEAKQIWEISSILECNGGAETIKAIGSKRLSVSSKLFSLFKTDNFNIERLEHSTKKKE